MTKAPNRGKAKPAKRRFTLAQFGPDPNVHPVTISQFGPVRVLPFTDSDFPDEGVGLLVYYQTEADEFDAVQNGMKQAERHPAFHNALGKMVNALYEHIRHEMKVPSFEPARHAVNRLVRIDANRFYTGDRTFSWHVDPGQCDRIRAVVRMTYPGATFSSAELADLKELLSRGASKIIFAEVANSNPGNTTESAVEEGTISESDPHSL